MYACVRIEGTGGKFEIKHSVIGLHPNILSIILHCLVTEGGGILLCLNLLDVSMGVYTSV